MGPNGSRVILARLRQRRRRAKLTRSRLGPSPGAQGDPTHIATRPAADGGCRMHDQVVSNGVSN